MTTLIIYIILLYTAMGGGPLGPIEGPLACLARVRPEMAALNAGSLNYLRLVRDAIVG